MCGIMGVIGKVEMDTFKKGLTFLEHRGPDGEGIWKDNGIILGHRRLAIIDTHERSNQPFELHDRFVITFNGEIYNYLELREILSSKGYVFNTTSDTEVLLNAYLEWGESSLSKLNGMWAFAIWDKSKRELFVSRDRVGEKPLFYMETKDGFHFASEMKAFYPILKNISPNQELIQKIISENTEYPGESKFFQYEKTDECLINGIKRFPAGSSGIYSNGQLKIKKYWDLIDNLVTLPNKENDTIEMFQEIFDDSCRIRMRSDVPISTTLSGGLDSSAITSTVNRLSSSPVIAFVACFQGYDLDEKDYAKQVVDFCQTDGRFIEMDPIEDIDNIFKQFYMFEELYLSMPLPFAKIYREIRKNGIKVCLEGHGGDELFAGYDVDIESSLLDAFPNIKQFLSIENTLKYVKGKNYKSTLATSLKKFILFGKIKHKIMHGDTDVKQVFPKYEGLDFLNSRLYYNSFNIALPTLLRNYDRYSMMNGVELRTPFLDYRLIQFAMSLPFKFKVNKGYSKYIVRKAYDKQLPQSIVKRKSKCGFNSPTAQWLHKPLKTWFLDQINSNDFQNCNLVNHKRIRQLSHQFYKTTNNNGVGQLLWNQALPYLWEKGLNQYR